MSFLEITNCNVCNRDDISPFLHLRELPLILRPLSTEVKQNLKENNNIPATMPLKMGICGNCGHMILQCRPTDDILNNIYENLYVAYPSGLDLGFATTDADDFLSDFRQHIGNELPKGSRILEIGCYDGYILSHLSRNGFDVVGCDPSEGADIGRKRGIPIIREFYSPDLFPRNHFNSVISRHIIEHINYPVNFVRSIRGIVVQSGNVIIETPNGGYHLQHGSLDPFHFEHLSVFTPASLTACIRKAGFTVMQMLCDNRNLIAICEPKAPDKHLDIEDSVIRNLITSAETFNHRFSIFLSELNFLIEKAYSRGKTIAIWGAGSMGITILTLLQSISDQVIAIVDRDQRKHGLSYFDIDIKVKSPEYLIEQPADIIIVCSQFTTEITRDIREKYDFTSTIVLLTPELKILA